MAAEIGLSYTFARGAVRQVHDPLPAFKLGRRLMVDRGEAIRGSRAAAFDRQSDVATIVDEIVADLRAKEQQTNAAAERATSANRVRGRSRRDP